MTNLSLGNRTVALRQAVDMLTTHLKAIVSVEFFTIPVYLTAVYSFTGNALSYTDPNATGDDPSQPLFDMQQKLLSVAVQEMYHLQLASNLCNALRVTPDIPQLMLPRDQEIPVPHLENVTIRRLGNAREMIDAMIAIEAPDPSSTYPPPNDTATYKSIADLYHATAQLMGLVVQLAKSQPDAEDVPPFDGGKQVSYGTFTSTYRWNTIPNVSPEADGPESALKGINAITDQGEGKDVLVSPTLTRLLGSLLLSGGDGTVDPEFQPAPGTRFSAYGADSHETRFQQVKETLSSARFEEWETAIRAQYQAEGFDAGVLYAGDGQVISIDPPDWTVSFPDLDRAIHILWSSITDLLASGFASGKLSESFPQDPPKPYQFNDVMLTFKYALPIMWRSGNVPSFTYRNVTDEDVLWALNAVDPYCLTHWDPITLKLRSDPSWPQNVCQGLNTCKGRGWGGTGVAEGGGDCACNSADIHTCGGGNSCKVLGACGYLSTDPASTSKPQALLPPEQQWIPGMNECNSKGGCQTPISTLQVFASSQKSTIAKQSWSDDWKTKLEALAATNVWEHARSLRGFPTTPPPKPPQPEGATTDYDGLKRRQGVQPSSSS